MSSTVLSELKSLWSEYKEREKKGETREQLKSLENTIRKRQRDNGLDEYNFDTRWSDNRDSLKRPTGEFSGVEQKPYTESEAEELLGEEKRGILRKLANEAIAEAKYLRDYIPKKDPDLEKNAAGIGQIINIAEAKYAEYLRNKK